MPILPQARPGTSKRQKSHSRITPLGWRTLKIRGKGVGSGLQGMPEIIPEGPFPKTACSERPFCACLASGKARYVKTTKNALEKKKALDSVFFCGRTAKQCPQSTAHSPQPTRRHNSANSQGRLSSKSITIPQSRWHLEECCVAPYTILVNITTAVGKHAHLHPRSLFHV